ncbi:MAG: aldo/keto reductase [Clostridia bacterium]|nr:aldo/keto reductase [Clostridia bacterium]
MIYKNFKDIKLSSLGMGCMRLPTTGGDVSKIDEEATEKMIDYAIANGVNYFDTAWGYHEGNSEITVGKILKKYPRDSFYLASKFPGYDISNLGKAEEIFEEQLRKCQTEYFDFYLFHNVCELNIDGYLDDKKYGDFSYLLEQKKNGRIKHLGFSIHGSINIMNRFLDAYGDHMEFCQIQLNYLDWTLQNAKERVSILKERNIPIWVMEPARGGRLANLEEKHSKALTDARPDEKPVAWAFRFLQSIPEVTVVLSGMSDFEQVNENIKTFSEDKALNENELKLLMGVADDMTSKKTLPCTSCRYCTSYCPQRLDIPRIIELYNEQSFSGKGFIVSMAMENTPEDKKPSACIGCRSCEEVCPQQIKISEMMSDFASTL